MTGQFSLIETILWEKGDYFLLTLHLKRLKKSAEYFSFDMHENNIAVKLLDISSDLNINKKYKIRLLLHNNGKMEYSLKE